MHFSEAFDFPSKDIDVLLIGEVLVDIIQTENDEKKCAGGSPYNIAKNLTKLGIKNKFYGAIGNDPLGKIIINDIKSNHLQTVINKTNKTTSFVRLNQTADSPQPHFHRGSDYLIPFTEQLSKDISCSKILHFTYWPLSLASSLDTLEAIVKEAPAHQTLIGFDPNYHPLLDNGSAKGLEAVKRIIKYIDIIKPSLDDSKRLFGSKTNEEYLDIYESLGAKLIIMTLGKYGLIARYKGATISMTSKAETVVDSTGAGDAFWSGLYAGLTRKHSIMDALILGLLCSAENLKVVGAEVDLPTIDILETKLRSN